LSRHLERNPNTISMILDRMERHSLVKKTRDTTDRRIVYVALTDKGKKIIKAAEATGDQIIDKFKDSFSEEERKACGLFVDKLDKVINQHRTAHQSMKSRRRRVVRKFTD